MGTTYLVQLKANLAPEDLGELKTAIDEELGLVNDRMSHYLANSELSRLNRFQAGEAFPLSAETFQVLSEALAVSRLTEGAFDVTVAPLVRVWGFGPGVSGPPSPPGAAELEAARERVGFERLSLKEDGQTATKEIDGLECDLSGIAKGYAVDRVAARLAGQGHRDFMVEVGGEVKTSGTNASGEPWRIAIEKPLPGTRAIQRILPLSGRALATSGDYRNFYEVEGKLYSHLIDPRKGRPVAHRLASVSVVAETCMRADALASGLLVMGPETGFSLAVKEKLAVLFLIRAEDGAIEERLTPELARLFSMGSDH